MPGRAAASRRAAVPRPRASLAATKLWSAAPRGRDGQGRSMRDLQDVRAQREGLPGHPDLLALRPDAAGNRPRADVVRTRPPARAPGRSVSRVSITLPPRHRSPGPADIDGGDSRDGGGGLKGASAVREGDAGRSRSARRIEWGAIGTGVRLVVPAPYEADASPLVLRQEGYPSCGPCPRITPPDAIVGSTRADGSAKQMREAGDAG